jgi:hypothetical protein
VFALTAELLQNKFHFVKVEMQLARKHQGLTIDVQGWQGAAAQQDLGIWQTNLWHGHVNLEGFGARNLRKNLNFYCTLVWQQWHGPKVHLIGASSP